MPDEDEKKEKATDADSDELVTFSPSDDAETEKIKDQAEQLEKTTEEIQPLVEEKEKEVQKDREELKGLIEDANRVTKAKSEGDAAVEEKTEKVAATDSSVKAFMIKISGTIATDQLTSVKDQMKKAFGDMTLELVAEDLLETTAEGETEKVIQLNYMVLSLESEASSVVEQIKTLLGEGTTLLVSKEKVDSVRIDTYVEWTNLKKDEPAQKALLQSQPQVSLAEGVTKEAMDQLVKLSLQSSGEEICAEVDATCVESLIQSQSLKPAVQSAQDSTVLSERAHARLKQAVCESVQTKTQLESSQESAEIQGVDAKNLIKDLRLVKRIYVPAGEQSDQDRELKVSSSDISTWTAEDFQTIEALDGSGLVVSVGDEKLRPLLVVKKEDSAETEISEVLTKEDAQKALEIANQTQGTEKATQISEKLGGCEGDVASPTTEEEQTPDNSTEEEKAPEVEEKPLN